MYMIYSVKDNSLYSYTSSYYVHDTIKPNYLIEANKYNSFIHLYSDIDGEKVDYKKTPLNDKCSFTSVDIIFYNESEDCYIPELIFPKNFLNDGCGSRSAKNINIFDILFRIIQVYINTELYEIDIDDIRDDIENIETNYYADIFDIYKEFSERESYRYEDNLFINASILDEIELKSF